MRTQIAGAQAGAPAGAAADKADVISGTLILTREEVYHGNNK